VHPDPSYGNSIVVLETPSKNPGYTPARIFSKLSLAFFSRRHSPRMKTICVPCATLMLVTALWNIFLGVGS